MTDHEQDRELSQWSRRVAEALQLLNFEVDQQTVLRVAAESAAAVKPAAGPITTFMVGYAAGLAKASGTDSGEAARTAADVVFRLCDHGTDGGPDHSGWTNTAQ